MLKSLIEAIKYHEECAEKSRFLGMKMCAAEHLHKAKRLKILLMERE